MPKNIEVAN